LVVIEVNRYNKGMEKKLVILDFDGTLADTMPHMLKMMDQLADHFKLKRFNPEDLPKMRQLPAPTIMKMHDIPMWKLPLMARKSHELLNQNIEDVQMFPGIEQVVKELAEKGIKIALVTSNTMDNVLKVLGDEITQLVSYFECRVGLFGKASKLRKVIRKAGVRLEEAISVGDEIRDIEAAQRLGLNCAAVTWGYADADALRSYNPDYVLTEPRQLMEIL